MRLQHNIPSINTHRNISFTQTKLNKSLEKLSSGYKINRAGDDTAGLAISEKMRGQIRGLNMAGKNIQDGISLIQTAEGAMNEIHAMLQRVRELTIQSANDTNTDEDREKIAAEVNAIFEEIDSITERTEFNGMKLLRGGGSIDPRGPGGGGGGSTRGTMLTGDNLISAQTDFTIRDFKANGASLINNVVTNAGVGAISEITGLENGEVKFGANKTDKSIVSDDPAPVNSTGFNYVFDSSTYYDPVMLTPTFSTISDAGEMKLQIGANSGQILSVIMPTITADALGLADVDVEILPDYSLGLLDNAINAISKERSKLGAIQNRLEHSYENVMNTAENLSAAESRIRDTDMAKK